MKHDIASLVTLYLDPDPKVHEAVEKHIVERGEQVVPFLDQVRSTTRVPEEKARLDRILLDVTYPGLYEDFTLLATEGLHSLESLEKAVLMVSRLEDPTLRLDWVSDKLDGFANVVRDRLTDLYTPDRQMKQLIGYVFKELNFSGDREFYHAPVNGYLHKVLVRRKGMPLTLSLIMLFLARRLDLPLVGVNMPVHFLLMYTSGSKKVYLDPFDDCSIVSLDQCAMFLKHNDIPVRPEYFQPCDEMDILRRFLRNLVNSYEKADDSQRVERLQHLLNAVDASLSL